MNDSELNLILRNEQQCELLQNRLKLQIVDLYEHDIEYKTYQICFFCIDSNSHSFCVKINDYNI